MHSISIRFKNKTKRFQWRNNHTIEDLGALISSTFELPTNVRLSFKNNKGRVLKLEEVCKESASDLFEQYQLLVDQAPKMPPICLVSSLETFSKVYLEKSNRLSLLFSIFKQNLNQHIFKLQHLHSKYHEFIDMFIYEEDSAIGPSMSIYSGQNIMATVKMNDSLKALESQIEKIRLEIPETSMEITDKSESVYFMDEQNKSFNNESLQKESLFHNYLERIFEENLISEKKYYFARCMFAEGNQDFLHAIDSSLSQINFESFFYNLKKFISEKFVSNQHSKSDRVTNKSIDKSKKPNGESFKVFTNSFYEKSDRVERPLTAIPGESNTRLISRLELASFLTEEVASEAKNLILEKNSEMIEILKVSKEKALPLEATSQMINEYIAGLKPIKKPNIRTKRAKILSTFQEKFREKLSAETFQFILEKLKLFDNLVVGAMDVFNFTKDEEDLLDTLRRIHKRFAKNGETSTQIEEKKKKFILKDFISKHISSLEPSEIGILKNFISTQNEEIKSIIEEFSDSNEQDVFADLIKSFCKNKFYVIIAENFSSEEIAYFEKFKDAKSSQICSLLENFKENGDLSTFLAETKLVLDANVVKPKEITDDIRRASLSSLSNLERRASRSASKKSTNSPVKEKEENPSGTRYSEIASLRKEYRRGSFRMMLHNSLSSVHLSSSKKEMENKPLISTFEQDEHHEIKKMINKFYAKKDNGKKMAVFNFI